MLIIRARVRDAGHIKTVSASEYAKSIRGMKVADDAIMNLSRFEVLDKSLGNREKILKAIQTGDNEYLRDVSDFFYRESGIYRRLCQYMSFLLTYSWILTPYTYSEKVNKDKILKDFYNVLNYLDNLKIKTNFSKISLEVIKQGVYYGIERSNNNTTTLQQLPSSYCRSRYQINGRDAVEFNVKYFDEQFRRTDVKQLVLSTFPQEFVKAYYAYISGNIPLDPDDHGAWFLCNPDTSVRFTIDGSELPNLVATIPAILDLDEAKEVDKKKTLQQLLKILVQKMPINKDGELVFDIDESQELHNNAVQMLSRAIGVDILTTFADVSVEDLSDSRVSTANTDSLTRMERGVFNEGGTSQMLFATNGNLALDKSVANDEANLFMLLQQYEDWLNDRIDKVFNKNNKKYVFKIYMPRLTIYNFKDMAKLFSDQSKLGYSKLLPAIALGQPQSFVLASMKFENEYLELNDLMTPVQMSSTMSGKQTADKTQTAAGDNKDNLGRPEKEDSQKSEKTIQNKESMK